MLSELRVRDLGIIEDLELCFEPGLTAITGETGAGKTLIVEAISLLLGGRADPARVRSGAAQARIEGRFSDLSHTEQTGLETERILSRAVAASGRSRAYLDGVMVTNSALADAGADLVSLHSQHSHNSLLAPSAQLRALDAFIGPNAGAKRATLKDAQDQIAQIRAELASIGGDPRERAREVDLLEFQINEINAARILSPHEAEDLAEQETVLASAAASLDAAATIHRELVGPILENIGALIGTASSALALSEVQARLRSVQAEISDIADLGRRIGEEFDADPSRILRVQERRHLLGDLCRKYGATLQEVTAYEQDALIRRDGLESQESRAAELVDCFAAAQAQECQIAEQLTALRRIAGPQLAELIELHLHDLAIPSARVEIAVTSRDEVGPTGADDVVFLLAPNPGEDLRPIAQAASGGELSRVMLALSMVWAGDAPIIVFDEVDVGIGGEAGLAVGRALARLSQDRQVFCVTHLAQVAACADNQIVVAKSTNSERTVASSYAVAGPDRIAELSRMLAGSEDSRRSREYAEELLSTALATR